MIPEFPRFKLLAIDDLPELAKALKVFDRQICELCLGNIYIWQDFDRPQLTRINGNICLQINPLNEAPFMIEPLGREKPPETIRTCLECTGRVSRLSKEYVNLIKSGFAFEPLRNQFDYVYETRLLAELKGKKFDGKRNHLKRFQRHFPDYKFISLTPEHKEACLGLFEKWFKVREESRFYPKLAHTAQKTALLSAFTLFKELDLFGGLLMTGAKVAGFTIGSRLNHATVSAHFAYGDPELPGIAQTLLWEGCNKTYSKFKYIDLEQDLGIPGLRTAKLSYHPLTLVEKFEIKS